MSIFDHSDYRPFVRARMERLPKRGRGEIHRMAKFVGVHPSLLSQILRDSRELSLEQAQLLTEYLALTREETEFFLLLVQYQRAGTVKLREYFKEKLQAQKIASKEIKTRVRRDRELNEEEKSVLYSHWLYAAVWLFSSLKNGCTLDEAATRFRISRERAGEILRFLQETGLCLAENGRYQMGPKSTHLARGSPHLTKHHSNWRLRAIEASDKIKAEELMYTAPLSLSRSDFAKIRARLAELIKEVTDTAVASDAEDIACFAMDFFWVPK